LNQNENIYKKVNRKVLVKSIIVGFLGGIFFSLFLLVLNYFKLIEINILSSIGKSLINNDKALFNWYGKIMLIIIVGILSIVLSLIYYVILKKLNAWYIGALYGFVIWILLYNGIPFLLRGNFIVTHYSVHTHINALCLFVLYGSFVGYTISFEYENELHNAMKK